MKFYKLETKKSYRKLRKAFSSFRIILNEDYIFVEREK